MNSKEWAKDIREIKSANDQFLSITNGLWLVKEKNAIFSKYPSLLFDSHLDLIRSIAFKSLSEKHPMFDLKPEERFAASIYGKKAKYSSELRKGIAETLAFLGVNGELLTNCSLHKPEFIVNLTFRELFKDSDWKLWASLNELLPILAEAAPEEFLTTVENTLRQNPCPFDELFNQESSGGLTSVNYLTGLYWALETLAWNPDYLSRSILVLAELATHDPGGRFANRPENSIVMILLPWSPKTLAPIDLRIASLRAIQNNFPEIAWKTLLRLLPNSHQVSYGSRKPAYRNWVSPEWTNEVTNKEYYEQIQWYADMAVVMAKQSFKYAKELVSNLDNLPKSSMDSFLQFLSSEEIKEKSEDEKQPIWEALVAFVQKHRRFSDAEWALSSSLVESIEQTANLLSPENPEFLHKILFSNHHLDFLNSNEDWRVHQERLKQKQIEAITQIYEINKISSITNFAKHVEDSLNVGQIFAHIASLEDDKILLPKYLYTKETNEKQFINGYLWSRYYLVGKEWIDQLKLASWSLDSKTELLLRLPFNNEIWAIANEILGTEESSYWKRKNINPYQTQESLLAAIGKLLENERPFAALECIYVSSGSRKEFYKDKAVQALIAGMTSSESPDSISPHHITELIGMLQDDPEINENDLMTIEWAYLSLLNEFSRAKPRTLEKNLSTKPDLFIDAIQMTYRSKNKSDDEEPDEARLGIASNAWKLLYQWKRPPGKLDDGTFSYEVLKDWFEVVNLKAKDSGHHEVALNHVGKVLFYVVSDPNGLWIHRQVAELLDKQENEQLRLGFKTEIYNSRGVHVVDPSGKPEQELAALWRRRADDVEKLGLIRFATSLKEIAKSYDLEADRIRKDRELDEV